MDSIIISEDVEISYKNRLVLEDINFEMRPGDFIYVIGQTGEGKSSFLKTLYADIPLQTGKLEVLDYSLGHIKNEQIPFLRRKLGIVFQDFELLNDRTIYNNLFFVLNAIDWKNKRQIDNRINEVMETLSIQHLKDKLPHQLSGGEKQCVSIGRSLLNSPQLLIADEPTGNLDPLTANDILNLLISINQRGTAILLATHQYHFLQKFPARTLHFQNKRLTDIPIGKLYTLYAKYL